MLGKLLADKSDRWALVAVGTSILLGLFVRLAEGYVTPVADSATYVTLASGISTNPFFFDVPVESSISGMAMRGVTYPLLIAGVLTAVGSLSAVAWLQSLVLVPATVWLLYAAGRTGFGPRVGLTAAWIYALWVPAQVYTSLIMQETWLAFLSALLMFLLARVITGASMKWSLATGLLLGGLAITHSAFQLVGIALLVALTAHWLAFDRSRLRQAVLVGVGLFAVLVPSLLIRQAFDLPQQGEGARGWGGGGGWTFWIGTRSDLGYWQPVDGWKFSELTADGQFAEVASQVRQGSLTTDPHLTQIILDKAAAGNVRDQTLTDADFYRAGLANLLDDPASWPLKVAYGINKLTTIPDGITLYRSAPSAAAITGPWTPAAAALLALALAGVLCLLVRARDRLVLAVPFVVQLAVLIAAYPENRHAIPLWGAMALFTGVAAGYAASAFQRMISPLRDPRAFLRVIAVLGCGLLIVVGSRSAAVARPVDAGVPMSKGQGTFAQDNLRLLVFGDYDLPRSDAEWVPAAPEVELPGTIATNTAAVPLRFGLTSTLTEYVPDVPKGCGLIVHGGHANWTEGGGQEVAAQGLAAGCRVITIDMPGHGANRGQVAMLASGDPISVNQTDALHNAFESIAGSGNALDVFVSPVVAGVDRLTDTGRTPIIMAGLSGGGWSTSLAAAVDPRITKSLAVAGSTTVDPSQPCGGDYEQCLPQLYSRASMEQIYSLAASGPGREHVQILNFYDPCCFAGNDGTSWTSEVERGVSAMNDGGSYVFIADRTQPGQHVYPTPAYEALARWETPSD